MRIVTIVKKYFDDADREYFFYHLYRSKMPIAELAKRCGISRQSLYGIIDGKFNVRLDVERTLRELGLLKN